MRLSELLASVRTLAPESLAESWDKVGLHVGDPGAEARAALLCVDLTPAVVAEAVARRAGLVVAYHPPIFEPLKTVTPDQPRSEAVYRAIRAGIAVYCPHTALDAATGGVNDWLAAGLGPGRGRAIVPAASVAGHVKLVTFVPPDHADKLRAALARAGAGCIGRYDECSFSHPGDGTFRGGAGTRPFIGRPGKLERTPETRIEMICRRPLLADAIAALRSTHPYEEPAFDLIPLLDPPESSQGAGRLWTLDAPTSIATLVRRIKSHLKICSLELASPSRRPVRTIAVCAGAGASVVSLAERDADVYFTGEMRHHDVLAATLRGKAVILAGHTQTERPYLPEYRRRLHALTGRAVRWAVSRADRAPGRVI